MPAASFSRMAAEKAYDTPSNISVIDGEIVLDGPDGVGLSMTVAAARETGRRLLDAADRAERGDYQSAEA